MNIEPYVLPESLELKIRSFMKRMGLVFGALDFIISEDHDYVFLEVNEQGQFLWIEEYNADFKMLDIFIQFLLQKSQEFKWNPRNLRHTIDGYRKEMVDMMTQNMQRHVDLNSAEAHNA